jgi:hypothetical protein
MEVIWYLPHVRVDGPIPLAENIVSSACQVLEHRGEFVFRRIDGMSLPDDHGDTTYLAFGNPAQLVLVVPGRVTIGLAEVAGALHRRHRYRFREPVQLLT